MFPYVLCAQIDRSQAYINGVNYVSTNMKIEQKHVDPLIENHISWAAVIPYAFMPDKNKPDLIYDSKWQWTGERVDGIRHSVATLKESGLHVMIKPQIWVAMGDYTGEILMTSERDWSEFESSYSSYILEFARIAEEFEVEMLCIGTELEEFAKQRQSFWFGLIKEVRKVYGGQLTYAENWDCFSDVQFFEELDYIGIDAYFPLKMRGKLTRKKLRTAWKDHLIVIDSAYRNYNKPVLFTEYGYRSVKGSADKPWEYTDSDKLSMREQRISLEVLLDTFWCKEWFAGGFLWKWWPAHDENGGEYDSGFTVQNKSAQEIMSDFYLRHTNCCERHYMEFTNAQ